MWYQRQVGQHQRSWNNYCLGKESAVDESCLTTSYKQYQDEDSGLLGCAQCFRLRGVICVRGILLGLLDT